MCLRVSGRRSLVNSQSVLWSTTVSPTRDVSVVNPKP